MTKFAIITHVPHIVDGKDYFAYGPYVREINVWTKYADQILIAAPKKRSEKSAIDSRYEHPDIEFCEISSFDLLKPGAIIAAFFKIPLISWKIFRTMQKADHIHLRCPGNIGLLGVFLQILFPGKPKTAKYAGNWDPNAKQPWSYRLQKWILSNTFLTRKMQVLVYGNWPGSTKSIKPFFTATYKESDKTAVAPRVFSDTIKFLFVGTLSIGKRPLYAIQLIERLQQSGYNVSLDFFGEGRERKNLEDYISSKNLENAVRLHGNQNEETVRNAYKNSHFLVLPSQSEGWPKVVAEAMFWGCIPIATAVSCVPDMIGDGKGIILKMDPDADIASITAIMKNETSCKEISSLGMKWSRQYTLDVFEAEIRALLTDSKTAENGK
ncbi:MAG TPA: glycosyltransferase family 4 protein [Flavobacterium sp.]|nr:glycosyltransferase family 4 protein [Flavobacterium sp.]